MDETIKNFAEQLSWQPAIENRDRLEKTEKVIVAGMGGSALAAGLWRVAEPKRDISLHRDYGLPRAPENFLRSSLIILSSYSGNTEETLDCGREAADMGLKLAVMTSGGKLLDWARRADLPYVVLPSGLEPRMALGYACKALGALTSDEQMLAMLDTTVLTPSSLAAPGELLGTKLRARIPVIYSASSIFPLAYHWKIALNETAKIPAFATMLPEANHNEMQGFDVIPATSELVNKFAFIFLRHDSDDPRIGKRMSLLQKLYQDRGLPVEFIDLSGVTIWAKIFHSFLLANWTALSLATHYARDPRAVPLIEEFKGEMSH